MYKKGFIQDRLEWPWYHKNGCGLKKEFAI